MTTISRRAADIVSALRQRMNEIVCDYDDADPDSVRRVGEAIDGTGFFPGADGLWRGTEPHGPMPVWFPKDTIMFVGHNFDKVGGYERSLKRGIEVINGPTWRKLREYIACASLMPRECFFTNALMGLQPIQARGPLKTTARFRTECRNFLHEQISIVRLRALSRSDRLRWPTSRASRRKFRFSN